MSEKKMNSLSARFQAVENPLLEKMDFEWDPWHIVSA
jgi:hypothetical protein